MEELREELEEIITGFSASTAVEMVLELIVEREKRLTP